MPLVGTKEMFKKAYEGGFAIGAFNINNMEIVQGITEAAAELNSPVILQASAGARKYAKGPYLRHLVEAALEVNDIPIALHLDHGPDLRPAKPASMMVSRPLCSMARSTSSKRTSNARRKSSLMHMSMALSSRLSSVSSLASRTM